MMRKLIETLIIELFEFEGISEKIKNKDGYFLYLSDLIDKLQSEKKWNLSRNTQQSLPNIKKYGDLSAHNRRFSSKKNIKSHLLLFFHIVFYIIFSNDRYKDISHIRRFNPTFILFCIYNTLI